MRKKSDIAIAERAAQFAKEDAKQRGLPIKEWVKMVGIARNTYFGWKSGGSAPDARAMQALVSLGCNANWLLTGRGSERL